MRKELNIFYTAILFYTRIPVPKSYEYKEEYMRLSARYFTLVGWLIGITSAEFFWIFEKAVGLDIAIILSMVYSIRLTGAFHEDGLADVCDGFGGGWNKENILSYMKDSRLGTFGVIGLISVLIFKFFCLRALPVEWIPIALVAGHSLSRTAAARMLMRGKYVENNNLEKAGSAAQKLSAKSFIINLLMGFTTLVLFKFLGLNNLQLCLTVLAGFSVFIIEAHLFSFFFKWIGGYNGDCAGTVQQAAEIGFYFGLVLIFKNTF
jgi:adenosylcobinamide-GDP ribazoletransferase